MSDAHNALTQVGAVGVILASLLGLFLWLFRRGVEHFLEQQKALVKHLQDTTEVLREIRNTLYSMQALTDAGRMEAVAQVRETMRTESDRVIGELKHEARKRGATNG